MGMGLQDANVITLATCDRPGLGLPGPIIQELLLHMNFSLCCYAEGNRITLCS